MPNTSAASTPGEQMPTDMRPYVLEAGAGEAYLLIDQVGRVLAGSAQSAGAWSVHSLIGPRGGPIPLHFHDREDEYFLCTQGQVQLWANGESRILNPGDFGFVPHGTVHAYQLLRDRSAFFGPILPGGWEGFFAFCGEPYDGPAYPEVQNPVIPFARFGQAAEKFGQTFLAEHEYAAPRHDAPDDILPGTSRPYFLRAGAGPRHVLGGQLQTILCSSAETNGTLAITSVLMSRGAGLPAHLHEHTVEAIYVLEGRLRLTIDSKDYLLVTGDFASIPPGTVHAHRRARRLLPAPLSYGVPTPKASGRGVSERTL